MKSSRVNPLLIVALAITGAIACWGIFDTANLAATAARSVLPRKYKL